MTLLDNVAPPIAKRIIDLFGSTAAIRVLTDTDYDVLSGGAGRESDYTDYPVKLAPDKASKTPFGQGTNNVSDEGRWLMAALDAPVVPTPKHLIVLGSELFSIIGVEPTYSGDQIALWTLSYKKKGGA